MKKLTALFLSLSLLVCSFLFASAAESSTEGVNVTEPASEVFIDNIGSSYESLELESGVDSSAEEEIREAIETFSEANDIKTEITTVGVTTEARETAEIQEVTTTRETAEPASDLEGVSSQEITETQETDANQETTESQEAIDSQEAIEAAAGPQEKTAVDGFLDKIFNVTIEWSGMNFTYCDTKEGTWNPDTGTYDNDGKVLAHWESSDTDESGAKKQYGTITIKNNDANTNIGFYIGFEKIANVGRSVAMKVKDNVPQDDNWSNCVNVTNNDTSTKNETTYYNTVMANDVLNVYTRPSISGIADYSILSTVPDHNLGKLIITIETLSSGEEFPTPPVPDSPEIFAD